MAPADSLARVRKHVIDRVAGGVVTVVPACRDAGISRSRFYELRARYRPYGEAGLRPKPRPRRPDRRLPAPLVDAIVAYAIEHPTEGPRSIAARLRVPRFGGWQVSHGGVYNALTRTGLNRTLARLAAAEALAASEGGPLTERTLRDLRSLERTQVRHLGSATPGAQLFVDTMYVGNRKGVGKIWPSTAVDGACSFGFARAVAGERRAATAAQFLEQAQLPVSQQLGIPLQQVTVDGGHEFKAAFRAACRRQGIRRHQLPPRSPDLNAFVERFQGTCLHQHYRIAFRYRFYTAAADLDADLQAWLRFYNFKRPHRGYRTQGRCPAAILYRNRPQLLSQQGWDPHQMEVSYVRS